MVKNEITNPKLKAQTFKARFLEKGVVQYEDEMVLIKPENLMKVANDFKGCHVIIDHKDINEENASEIVGYINNVWFDDFDGWAWCDFTVNNEEAINLINKGYSVSCAYIPEYAQGGTYHNIPFDREIIGGEAIHLAIVENPRYEDAIILKNSIKQKVMTIFKFKKPKENKAEIKEIELENAMFEIAENETVSVSKMIEAYKNAKKNEEEEKKNQEEEEKKEAKVNADDEYEIEGEMVKVSELAKYYKEAKKKNAEEEEEKKNAEEEEEEKKNQEEEEKKKEAKKNSVDAEKIKEAKARFDNGISGTKESEIHTYQRSIELGKIAFGKPQEIK